MRILDAHQHFWRIDAPGIDWPTAAEAAIHRSFGPSDLWAETADQALIGTVLVQSQPNDDDTDWMLALAATDRRIRAVVGWADLTRERAPARIAMLAGQPGLVGLRPMLQSIADTDWLLAPAIDPAISAMVEHRLRLDALVQPRHLPMLAEFMARWPGLPVVINHGAKPHVARGVLDPWRADIARLADLGAWCKLSGLRTEQAPGQDSAMLRPYVEHLVACFGDRLMWGSDWPVQRLVGDDWGDWVALADRFAGPADRARLFHGAAAEFYRID